MLAGAIVIIVQAPRCKPIPEMNWWNQGPLYQISDLESFSEGMEGRVPLVNMYFQGEYTMLFLFRLLMLSFSCCCLHVLFCLWCHPYSQNKALGLSWQTGLFLQGISLVTRSWVSLVLRGLFQLARYQTADSADNEWLKVLRTEKAYESCLSYLSHSDLRWRLSNPVNSF